MFGPSQVINCFFLVLQSFEDHIELPSPEDIGNFVKEQDQKYEELHFKVWLRMSDVIFYDPNVPKSGIINKDHSFYYFFVDGIILVLEQFLRTVHSLPD